MSIEKEISILIVGMGCISRHMHGVLKTKPWYRCVGVVDVTDAGLAARKP
jgi:hypothetical protein